MMHFENPVRMPKYQLISMPMPRHAKVTRYAKTLWRPGARVFLRDQGASTVDDILTTAMPVFVSAKFFNKTTRARSNLKDADLPALGGLDTQISKVLPKAVNPTYFIEFGSKI